MLKVLILTFGQCLMHALYAPRFSRRKVHRSPVD